MSVATLSSAAIQTALRTTTETLACELACPGPVAPDWSEAEWLVARATASIHGVAALLADRLIWEGPASWQHFLTEQKQHTARRFGRIAELLDGLRAGAHAKGVALIALKGAALYLEGFYSPGERPMADIDLLSSPEQGRAAGELLEALGFRERYATWKHRVFETRVPNPPAALGEHVGNSIQIELHTRAAEVLPRRPVDITELMFPRVFEAGLNTYPSKSALLMHVLLHASGSMIFRGLRMIHLQDIARICERMTNVDWEQFFQTGEATADPTLWWAYPPLSVTHRYQRCVPPAVLERTAAGCHRLLKNVSGRRTLSDVSLSYLWVSAFPGIEWAQSAREMLAYGVARVRPSPETRQLRELFAKVQPRVSGGSWARLSQRRRLLRWLVSREVRHESIEPVRAALACVEPAGTPSFGAMLPH